MKRLKLDGEKAKISEGVPIFHEIPVGLEFYMKYFDQHQPVLIRNAVQHWPAMHKWKTGYLNMMLGNRNIDVEIRPDNYPNELIRDAAGKEHFVWPLAKETLMREFLQHMHESTGYIQNLSSCIVDNFPELLLDIDLNSLNFITDCWGDATLMLNIEDRRSFSDLHMNNSENIFIVISGYKDFVLVPSFQQQFVPMRRYPTARWKESPGGLILEKMVIFKDAMEKEWVALNALRPNLLEYRQYEHCTPLEVRVEAGNLLYLPRHYFRHIRQSHGCISITAHYEYAPFELYDKPMKKVDIEKLEIKPFGCP